MLVQADSYRNILLTNLRCSFLFVSLLVLQSLNPNVNVVFLSFVLHFILLIGNVELNPGPETYISSSPPNLDNSSNHNSISLCNINIRSIRNKTNFVQHFADEFDIQVITESHLDNSIQNDDIELCSFTKNIQRPDRQNQTGGGLLIYTKENVNISRIIQLENNLDESLWVQIHEKGQSFLLCNTVCPQWTDNEYWSRLTHAIELAHQINENIVISGDLNSNLFNVNNNKLVDLMTTFNFRNVIVKPTRLNNLLDPIIISDTMTPLYSDVFKMPSEISDHDAAVAFLKCPKSTSCSFTREIWQYENIDLELFNNKMNEINWNEMIGFLNDVDDIVEEFTKLFLDIARQSIPTKTITVRDYDKPWFNNEIRKEIRLRDRLRKNVFKFGRESDTLKYKKQRNKVNNMKKKAKENFESFLDNILLDNSTNPKTYWKIMKMLIKSNKGSNCIPPLRNTINDEHLDEILYDDDKKCELLNKYFSLVSKLEEENIPVPPFESKTNDSITDIFVTASEIVDFIQILDLKKASVLTKSAIKCSK